MFEFDCISLLKTIGPVIAAAITCFTFYKKLKIIATCNVIDDKKPIIGLRIKIYPTTIPSTLKSIRFDYPILRVQRPDGKIIGSIPDIELYSYIATNIPIFSKNNSTNPIGITVWIADETYNPSRDIFTANFSRYNGTLKIEKKTF